VKQSSPLLLDGSQRPLRLCEKGRSVHSLCVQLALVLLHPGEQLLRITQDVHQGIPDHRLKLVCAPHRHGTLARLPTSVAAVLPIHVVLVPSVVMSPKAVESPTAGTHQQDAVRPWDPRETWRRRAVLLSPRPLLTSFPTDWMSQTAAHACKAT